jgi:tetratricopeptide (TPR) repeat protein/transcriptional regulator with XRE-family HTH domain
MHPEADSPSFATMLRRFRRATGLTQEELAERARLSVRGITDLERSARLSPRKETVQLLADALQLAPTDRERFEAAARSQRPMANEQHEPAALPPVDSDPGRRALPDRARVPSGGFLGALPSGPLVGREPELGRLVGALDEMANGHGCLVLLAGEPGVGKTRLAQELMQLAEGRGFLVLTGRCYEQYASLPFFPFVEALTTAMAAASPALRLEVPRRFSYMGAFLPDLFERPLMREGEDVRLRIWHAVGGFLAALAAETPVALLLDDLHWADSASLELLLHLARRAAGDRVLLAGTYRDVEVNRQHPLEAALGELVRERLVEEVSLRGLSPAGTAALIGAHLGFEKVSLELCDLLHARTEGNPFFVEEVLKALVERDAVSPSAEAWDRKAIGAIDVPRSIRSVVGRRVGRLAPEAQEMLVVASVLGQEWDLDLLLGAAEMDQESILRYVEAALKAKLLEERRVGRRERYAFAHALIGQALYEEAPRFRLRKLHLRAGEALERAHAERPEAWAELARHFLAAGEEGRATRYALLAADHAASLYAHAEAVQHYEAALALQAEAGDVAGAAQVRARLGMVLRTIGRYSTALAVLDQAAETYSATGDLDGLARVTAQIGQVHAVRGTMEEGIARVQPVLEIAQARGPSPALADLHKALARLLILSGRYSELLAVSTRLMDLAGILGDDHLLAHAHLFAGLTLLAARPVGVAGAAEPVGRVAKALRLLEEAHRLAEANGDLELRQSMGDVAYCRATSGEFAASRRDRQQALLLAERLGDPMWICFHRASLGWNAFVLGEWDQARADTGQAVTMSRQMGVGWAAPYPLLHWGQLRMAEGQWEDASQHLEEACALVENGGDLQALRQAAALLAELEILTGRPGAARARLVPLLDRPGLEEYDVTALLPVLAWAYLELGETARASDVVMQAVQRTRSEGLRLVLVEALRVQAMIAARQGLWTEAEMALAEGLALAQAMFYPYAEARLLHLSGRLHAPMEKSEATHERLTTVLAIFQRLGARKDIEQVERDLAACPGRIVQNTDGRGLDQRPAASGPRKSQ